MVKRYAHKTTCVTMVLIMVKNPSIAKDDVRSIGRWQDEMS